MMRRRWTVGASAGVMSALIVLALVGLAVVFPVSAAPGAQGDLPATPTLAPLVGTPYTLERIGGEAFTQTVSYADQDGFTLGAGTVFSEYPQGLIFTLEAESVESTIADVTLHVTYRHGVRNRASAEYDPARDVWVAELWPAGGTHPAWQQIDFYWRVRDDSGTYVDTETFHTEYWDPQHVWFRVESEHMIGYWRGFSEDDPDDFAQRIVDSIAAHDPRWVTIFGERMEPKPAVIIYPDSMSIVEFQVTSTESAGQRTGGYYSSEVGMSVQKLYDIEPPPENVNCFWETPPDQRTMQWREDTTISIISHEFTHIYQNALAPGARGLVWVYEGQAEWIENSDRLHEERMRRLADLGADLPSLTEQASYLSTAADGCYRLAYSMGDSFYNFLYHNYGGIDAVAFVVQRWADGASMVEAVEELTGKPFLEVENEWRVGMGFPALTAADLDPALALQPYEDSMLAVGDMVTLPASPALVPLAEQPVERSLVSGQCFANTPVEILRMGTLDDVAYFEIDCMGMQGWVTREQLVGP